MPTWALPLACTGWTSIAAAHGPDVLRFADDQKIKTIWFLVIWLRRSFSLLRFLMQKFRKSPVYDQKFRPAQTTFFYCDSKPVTLGFCFMGAAWLVCILD